MRLSNREHNPSIVSGNVAYSKPVTMGFGYWTYCYPAFQIVDGNEHAVLEHHSCAWADNGGRNAHSFKIDLKDFYDIEQIVLHATSRECRGLENRHDTISMETLTRISLRL